MELNKKILSCGIFFIFLILAFTVVFTLVNRLDEPVFLNMYMEENIYKNPDIYSLDNFQLKYITNIGDKRRIIDVYFKEAPDLQVDVSYNPFGFTGFSFFHNNSDIELGDRYWIYSLKTIYLNIFIDDEEFEDIEINEAVFKFDDGSTLDVNLGRIIFYKDDNIQEDLEHLGSSSSSDGSSRSFYNIKKDIRLINLDSPILEKVKDKIAITIAGYDYSQIEGVLLEANRRLYVNTIFKEPGDIVEKYTYYSVHPKLYYENSEGETFNVRIYNIHHYPFKFTAREIYDYLKSRGEI